MAELGIRDGLPTGVCVKRWVQAGAWAAICTLVPGLSGAGLADGHVWGIRRARQGCICSLTAVSPVSSSGSAWE